MSTTNTNVVPMPVFSYVIRSIVLVLSVVVLGLAANTLIAMRSIYGGDSYYDSYYSYYNSYNYYGDYYYGNLPGTIRNSCMGLVVFVVSRSRVES